MNMDTEALRWFTHVADGETVTDVAALYQVSQPTVSRALSRLEREVGAPLLTKNGRLLRLTHAGAEFKRGVDQVIHVLDDTLAAMHELTDPETGVVRFAFQLSLGTWLIPPLVGEFKSLFPRVTFELIQSQDILGSSLVAQGEVDLELTARRPQNPEVAWRPLFHEQLYLALPPTHRLAERQEAALEEVGTEKFVMLKPTWQLRNLADELCREAGFEPHVVFEGDDLPTLLGFVAAGLGISIVPAMSIRPDEYDPQGARLIPIKGDEAFRVIGMVWSKNRRLLPAARIFRKFVGEQLPELVTWPITSPEA